ncbi:MAG: ribosome biogenesis GTP-binding protein YihA/YsxC [Pseudomonadota bacterium]
MIPFTIDPEQSPEEVEQGRLLFAGPCDFVKGVVAMDGLPAADRPEICVAGRSNVGKSSLLNALTNRKGLARASNTPGRTQEINYFALGPSGYLVDLPGYGFAEAPVAKVDQWQRLLKSYLAGRVTLARAFVLIDSRHGVKPVDHEIMDLLDKAAVSFQAVLTKTDKPKSGVLTKTLSQVREDLARHPTAYPEILTTSSETKAGIAPLRAVIAGLFAR